MVGAGALFGKASRLGTLDPGHGHDGYGINRSHERTHRSHRRR